MANDTGDPYIHNDDSTFCRYRQLYKSMNRTISAGGSVDVAMTKDHMAVVTSGGVDFYDMNYTTFKWDRIQSKAIPSAHSVDIDGNFARGWCADKSDKC